MFKYLFFSVIFLVWVFLVNNVNYSFAFAHDTLITVALCSGALVLRVGHRLLVGEHVVVPAFVLLLICANTAYQAVGLVEAVGLPQEKVVH